MQDYAWTGCKHIGITNEAGLLMAQICSILTQEGKWINLLFATIEDPD